MTYCSAGAKHKVTKLCILLLFIMWNHNSFTLKTPFLLCKSLHCYRHVALSGDVEGAGLGWTIWDNWHSGDFTCCTVSATVEAKFPWEPYKF